MRQQRDAPVEIVVAEHPDIDADLGVEAISGMNLVRFGRSPQERVEDRAPALIAARCSQHGHLRIGRIAGARSSQPGGHAREDRHVALSRETGNVAVEVIEVQELDSDGAIQWQEAGWHLHARRWDDLGDRPGRRIAGEEIERSIRRAVGIGLAWRR